MTQSSCAVDTSLRGVVETASRHGFLVVLTDDGTRINVEGGRSVRKGERVVLVKDDDGDYVVS